MVFCNMYHIEYGQSIPSTCIFMSWHPSVMFMICLAQLPEFLAAGIVTSLLLVISCLLSLCSYWHNFLAVSAWVAITFWLSDLCGQMSKALCLMSNSVTALSSLVAMFVCQCCLFQINLVFLINNSFPGLPCCCCQLLTSLCYLHRCELT